MYWRTQRTPRVRARALLLGALPVFLMASTALPSPAEGLPERLQRHAANKQSVLEQIRHLSQLDLTRCFGKDFREVWRWVLIDGPHDGTDKRQALCEAITRCDEVPLRTALAALMQSHQDLFGSGHNRDLMVRYASHSAFEAFGRHMTPAEALAEMTADNDAEVQAFQTIFETGQNTRGYVHKLECHATAVEFIYAVTDIVYGVMLPSALDFGPEKVAADPKNIQLFYIKAGEVVALHPYVLHSGSLSVEPDRSFSIIIYKKPAPKGDQPVVRLPQAWQDKQRYLKLAGIDKYYLTLEELHQDDLKNNRGYITSKRPIRLPTWK